MTKPERHHPLKVGDIERVFNINKKAAIALRKNAVKTYGIKSHGSVTFGQILNANMLNE
jgi:hypothetical protein